MKINFYELNNTNKPSIVVIYAKYNDKIIMCKHKGRDTWEIPGGHIEKDETQEKAAKRELYEETGALEFSIIPVFKYSFELNGKIIFAIMFEGQVTKIDKLPDFEIEEVGLFDEIPKNVTYPEIYDKILNTNKRK